jgi:hypothetical protein
LRFDASNLWLEQLQIERALHTLRRLERARWTARNSLFVPEFASFQKFDQAFDTRIKMTTIKTISCGFSL